MATATSTGCYVFAIVPAGSSLPSADAEGPAAGLALVVAGDLAAVVGRVPTDRPLGRSADLRAHDRVIADMVASGTPVLPMRFGAVLADEAAVADELLAPHREEFAEALVSLRGRVQYTLRVRYDEERVLRELLATRPDIRRLREAGGGGPSGQLRLGESVVHALEQLRPADASAILADLLGTVDLHVHEPSAPEEVLDAAFLVDVAMAPEFERRVEHAAEQRAGRLHFRLVGPTAAYDFVGSP